MNSEYITKEFWKLMNELNRADIESRIYKDMVMDELNSSSYSMTKLETIYKNGIPEKGLGCFYGENFGMVILGYSLLIRYGLNEKDYIQWCDKVKEEFHYLLYRLIGRNDPKLKKLYYKNELTAIMTYFVENKRKLFTVSNDKASLFTIYGQNLFFHEKMQDIVNYYKFGNKLKTDMVVMFEKQYHTMIHKFDDCKNFLMMIIKDINEVAINRLNGYIKNIEHSQEKVDQAIEQYLDSIPKYTPYAFFIEEYNNITGQCAENKINVAKHQVFSDPNFLAEMIRLTRINIGILCDVVLNVIPLGENVSFDNKECKDTIDRLYKISAFLKKKDLKKATLLILQVYPFMFESYKFAYDTVGDNNNELEILAVTFGVDKFYDYKISKEPDGLTDVLHCKIKKEVLFGFEEIIKREQELFPIVNHMEKFKSYLDTSEVDYLEIQKLIEQLMNMLEKCGISKEGNWSAISAQQFYLKKKLDLLLRKISLVSCSDDNNGFINYFERTLNEKFLQHGGNCFEQDKVTKNEILECLDFVCENTVHSQDDGSTIIKYENWISKKAVSYFNELKIKLEQKLNEEKEKERRQKEEIQKEEEKRRAEEKKEWKRKKREEDFKKYITLYRKNNIESTDFYKSYKFRNHFKSIRNKKEDKYYLFQYDFEVEDINLRKFIRDKEGGFGGQYILYCNTKSGILLTDHNLYTAEEKISLWQIRNIIVVESFAPILKETWAVIETLEKRIPISSTDFAMYFNFAMDAIQQGTLPYDKKKVFYCRKCNSINIRRTLLGHKCLDCGNDDAAKIASNRVWKESDIEYDRSQARKHKYVEEDVFLQWCEDLFPEIKPTPTRKPENISKNDTVNTNTSQLLLESKKTTENVKPEKKENGINPNCEYKNDKQEEDVHLLPLQKNLPNLTKTILKGQKLPVKNDGDLEFVEACFGWNILDSQCDVDVSVFLLGADGKVLGDSWVVFYGQTVSPDQSISFSTNSIDDREVISIDFKKLNPDIKKIVFVVTIDKAIERHLHFGMIKEAYVRILDVSSKEELFSFKLEESDSNITSMIIGELYYYKGIWKFNAVGNGFAKELEDLCLLYGVQIEKDQ